MNEKELRREAKKNPLLKQLRADDYSPLDLLLTRYYPLETRSYLEVHHQLNNAINDMPEIKWLLLTMAYWSLLGTDIVSNSANIKRGRKRFKIVEAENLDGIDENLLGVYTHKHAIFVKPSKDFVGTLIHEGTHAVADLIYDNFSLPYLINDKAAEEYWLRSTKKIIEELAENKERIKGSSIFSNIEKSYSERSYISEMIARIFEHYVSYPNENFSALSLESQKFILNARFEFAKHCRQWCMNFVRDTGLNLLPGNKEYSADVKLPLRLTRSGLQTLQAAQKNHMSILEYRLTQLLEIADPKVQFDEFQLIIQSTDIVDLFRVVCKFPRITDLVFRMRDQGHNFLLDSITEANIKRGLFFAARYGNSKILAVLFKIKPDLIIEKDSDGQSIFYWLAASGHSELLIKFLQQVKKEHLNCFDHAIETALEGVLRFAQRDTLEVLMQHFGQDIHRLKGMLASSATRTIRIYSTLLQTSDAVAMLQAIVKHKIAHLDNFAMVAAMNNDHKQLQDILNLAEQQQLNMTPQTLGNIMPIAIKKGWLDIVEKIHQAIPEIFEVLDSLPVKLMSFISKYTSLSTLNYLYVHHYSKTAADPTHAIVTDDKLPPPTNLDCCNDQLETVFHVLAREGNPNIMWMLAKTQYPVLGFFNRIGDTPIQFALRSGHIETAKNLIRHPDWTQFISGKGDKVPLMVAIEKGLFDFARDIILAEPVSLVMIDQEGRNVAFYAAKYGDMETLKKYQQLDPQTLRKRFTTKKIDLNAKDKQGLTPLYAALCNGQSQTARYLMGLGFTLEVSYQQMLDCINGALQKKLDLDLIVALINDLRQPIEWISVACRANNQEAVLKLIELYPYAFGITHLKDCIDTHSSLTQILLAKMDPSWRDELIIHAASLGATDLIQLLAVGVDEINAHDSQNMTALHYAALRGHTEVVKLLLRDKNVDVNSRDLRGRTALYCAIEQGKELTALYLFKKHTDITLCPTEQLSVFLLAVTKQMHSLTEQMLESVDPEVLNQTDQHKMNALHYAVMQGDLDLTRRLLARGANLNAQDADGLTPLHLAASTQDRAMMTLLLKYSPDQSLKDHQNSLAAEYDDCGILSKPKLLSSSDHRSSSPELVDALRAEVQPKPAANPQQNQEVQAEPPRRGYRFGDVTRGALKFFKTNVVNPMVAGVKKPGSPGPGLNKGDE